MKDRVLWLDNDPGYIRPFALALEEEGFEVILASTVFEGEKLLRTDRVDLLILDVMIPTMSEEEEAVYSPSETDLSLRTGLIFYSKNKELIREKNVPVLVMTVRIDKAIRVAFLDEGLPENCFVTKMELRNSADFVARIKEAIVNSRGGTERNG